MSVSTDKATETEELLGVRRCPAVPGLNVERSRRWSMCFSCGDEYTRSPLREREGGGFGAPGTFARHTLRTWVNIVEQSVRTYNAPGKERE